MGEIISAKITLLAKTLAKYVDLSPVAQRNILNKLKNKNIILYIILPQVQVICATLVKSISLPSDNVIKPDASPSVKFILDKKIVHQTLCRQ